MRTSKETLNNIKNGIITEEMLESALYSVNKRAKNHRDKERKYKNQRYGLYNYENMEKSKEKKEEMYSCKEKLLSIIKPTCIHKEPFYRKKRVYDYEDNCDELWNEYNDSVFNVNCYYDEYREREVDFFDYVIRDYRYYLFYELKKHSYHQPIEDYDVDDYDLEVKEINKLQTHGDDIHDLMSLQTVRKIIKLIEDNNYTYITEK